MTAAALARTHGSKCRTRLHERQTTGRLDDRRPVNALLPRGNGSLRRSPRRPSRSHRLAGSSAWASQLTNLVAQVPPQRGRKPSRVVYDTLS